MLGKLLKPFMQGTIRVDWVGRQVLIGSENSLADKLFSVGDSGAQKLIKQYTHFSNLHFPTTMEERGFPEDESDGVKNFFFRTDGYKLWNIFERYVKGIIDRIYHSDLSVRGDTQLQAFASSLADLKRGKIYGFPSSIQTKEALVKTMTTIVFTASVLHHVSYIVFIVGIF